MSSSAISASTAISPSSSTIWVRRSSANCLRTSASSSLMTAMSRCSLARIASRRSMVAPGERRGHEVGLGLLGRGRGADDLDDTVDVGDGDDQALDDLLARARLLQFEQRAARDDVAAMVDEVGE